MCSLNIQNINTACSPNCRIPDRMKLSIWILLLAIFHLLCYQIFLFYNIQNIDLSCNTFVGSFSLILSILFTICSCLFMLLIQVVTNQCQEWLYFVFSSLHSFIVVVLVFINIQVHMTILLNRSILLMIKMLVA